MADTSPLQEIPLEAGLVYESRVQTRFGAFHFRRFLPAAEAGQFGVFAPLVRLWQGRCRDGALPRWQDFTMEDFVGWHRNLALSDFPAGALQPRFRLFGSRLADWMGMDLTGRHLSDAVPSAESDGILHHLARVRDEGAIGLVTGNVGLPGLEHRDLHVLELPLRDERGQVVQLFHGIPPV